MQRFISSGLRQLYSRHYIQQKSVNICRFSTKSTASDDKSIQTVELDKETLLKLERLSGLQFKDQKEIDDLKEEIRFANKIFEVDTTGVEPLYNIVEEIIDCPLREDEPVKPVQSKIFANAAEHVEGFFVSPPANVVVDESETLKEMK